jgi:hypothetical protein
LHGGKAPLVAFFFGEIAFLPKPSPHPNQVFTYMVGSVKHSKPCLNFLQNYSWSMQYMNNDNNDI